MFGRTDRLYVKRYEEETNLRCQILIDNSSSMHYPVLTRPDLANPNKIIFSVYIAAALIYLFHKQRDAAGISIFSEKIEFHSQSKSNSLHNKYLFRELEKLLLPSVPDEKKGTAITAAIHELAERIHKRSLVIIFSDMFENVSDPDEIFSALQHLKHNKHEVIIFHVVDKSTELNFEFENRPYKFIDIESGKHIRVLPSRLKLQYLQAVRKFQKELILRCGFYHIDLVETDINAGFEQVLLPYLVKRSKLF